MILAIYIQILNAFLSGEATSNSTLATLLDTSKTEIGRHLKTMSQLGLLSGDGFTGWKITDKGHEALNPAPVVEAAPEPVVHAPAPVVAPVVAEVPVEAPAPIIGSSRADLKLGSFAWWDLDKSRITPLRMREVLDAEGMLGKAEDGKIEVPDIDPLSAIRRACSSWGEGRSNSKSGFGKCRAEVTQSEGGVIYVGILQHTREGHKEVAWKQIELLAYDSNTGTWINKGLTDTSQSFQKEADDFLINLDHRWIRPCVIEPEFTAMLAVRLKRGGGFYFIRNDQRERLMRLKRIITSLGSSKLHTVAVDADEDTKVAVSGGIRETVLDQVVEIKATLTEWRESTRKIRTDSQATLLTQLSELISFAGLYESVLEVTLADLRAEVVACQDEAMALLAPKEKAVEAAVEAIAA